MSAPQFNGPLAELSRRAQWGILRHGKPDPWSPEIDAAVKDPSAVPLCVNCLHPQDGHFWFCPHCAFPSGQYVASMPYLYILVQGECLRRGVMGPPERRPGVLAMQALFAAMSYPLFAPVYWYWMIRRAQGRPICHEKRRELQFEDDVE